MRFGNPEYYLNPLSPYHIRGLTRRDKILADAKREAATTGGHERRCSGQRELVGETENGNLAIRGNKIMLVRHEVRLYEREDSDLGEDLPRAK